MILVRHRLTWSSLRDYVVFDWEKLGRKCIFCLPHWRMNCMKMGWLEAFFLRIPWGIRKPESYTVLVLHWLRRSVDISWRIAAACKKTDFLCWTKGSVNNCFFTKKYRCALLVFLFWNLHGTQEVSATEEEVTYKKIDIALNGAFFLRKNLCFLS